MQDHEWLAQQFETHRMHLLAVARRMLGSTTEADDALQEAWLRVSRADTSAVENLGGWLTTVVARVCLDLLRAHDSRREEPVGARPAEPVAGSDGSVDPEQNTLLTDAIGPALLVVLQTLSPGERLAFVLHDMFGVPFDEIGPIAGCTSTAARQLASRGRRRVQGTAAVPGEDNAQRKEIVAAFLAASRHQDYNALLAVLDPEIVIRADAAAVRLGVPPEIRGLRAAADALFKGRGQGAQVVIVNGSFGVTWAPGGRPRVVLDLTITEGRISAIDLIADPESLEHLDLEVPGS